MLKLIKYGFIYVAAFMMLLHNVIPHAHESELNNSQHIEVHQSELSSPIDLLALIFHEFTEEGEMENFVVNSATSHLTLPAFTLLFGMVNTASFVLIKEPVKELNVVTFLLEEIQYSAGFSTAWSVRPPPCA